MPNNIHGALYYHTLSTKDGVKLSVVTSTPNLSLSELGPVAVVSGGYDPLHRGHLVNINEAARISAPAGAEFGPVVVIANGDRFLREKRKYDPAIPAPFLDLRDRLATVSNLKPVVFAIESIDDDKTVCKTLEQLSLVEDLTVGWFANGGDRGADNVPESTVCERHGIELRFGCGTTKEESSSSVLERASAVAAVHSTKHEDKRWGRFATVAENGSWAKKALCFAGKEGLSLQTHARRSEIWHCMEGEGILCLGALTEEGYQIFDDGQPVCGSAVKLFPGQKIEIAQGQAHMACNTGSGELIISETWVFTDPEHRSDEEDITKYGDPFNEPRDVARCRGWLEFTFPLPHTQVANSVG
jgi:mannose-6-phosphate isomerase-like protein (cupin superfamily)